MIILTHGESAALIDTGFDEQYEQLSSYLGSLGITDIEFILLTHFHRDHYGNIERLTDNYKVDKVYLKEYSGLDCTTAWGTEADSGYRKSEMEKYERMREHIRRKSTLIQAEDVSEIAFGPYMLRLFMTENTVRRIYDDAAYPDTYKKIMFSENQNSIAVYINADGKNIFLGGDLLDIPSSHPLGNYVNLQIAEQLGCEMDIYKAPHHGTINTGCTEALEIYRPKIAVITNENEYLSKHSDIYEKLKNANPDVRILLTDDGDIVLDTDMI